MQRREVAASSLLRLFLHVVQVDFEGADRNLDFPDRHAQRTDQQQQRRAEDIGRKDEKSDIQQEHRHHAEKKARNAQNLHRAREVQAAAQVVDLRAGDFRGVLECSSIVNAFIYSIIKSFPELDKYVCIFISSPYFTINKLYLSIYQCSYATKNSSFASPTTSPFSSFCSVIAGIRFVLIYVPLVEF